MKNNNLEIINAFRTLQAEYQIDPAKKLDLVNSKIIFDHYTKHHSLRNNLSKFPEFLLWLIQPPPEDF